MIGRVGGCVVRSRKPPSCGGVIQWQALYRSFDFGNLRRVRRAQWTELGPALAAAIQDVEEKGYCAASWQAEVVAVATPLVFQRSHYALNVSLSTSEPLAEAVRELAPTLLALKADIQRELDAVQDG